MEQLTAFIIEDKSIHKEGEIEMKFYMKVHRDVVVEMHFKSAMCSSNTHEREGWLSCYMIRHALQVGMLAT